MYQYEHPRPAVTVDLVIFSIHESQLNMLLIQRGQEPYKGQWALPGGFVKMDEPLEKAAQRELAEETGIDDQVYLEQLYTYGDPDRDPRGRVITVAYFALIPTDTAANIQGSSDADQANWFSIENLPQLAFDHLKILRYALKRLRYKLEYSAVGFEMLPEEFTLSELQRTYEIILGEKLDKRNFRRRILQANIIEVTSNKRIGEGRPAKLYRYRKDAIDGIKARRLFP